MRHIDYDPTKLVYPEHWSAKADTARLAVNVAQPDVRAQTLNKHSDVWASLKHELAKISNGKCWYTEAPQAGTDTDVDHFRPKNSIKGVHKIGTGESHPGYWWCAFDPNNFRSSCIVANRRRRDVETGFVGGKADEFPISDETRRAWVPGDNCDLEQPELMDPCNEADIGLITFVGNGEAMPTHTPVSGARLARKAAKSIELYHLNHSEFVRARIGIRDALRQWIEDAKRYYLHLEDGDAVNDHAYKRAIVQ